GWVEVVRRSEWLADDRLRAFVGPGPQITDDRPRSEYFLWRRAFMDDRQYIDESSLLRAAPRSRPPGARASGAGLGDLAEAAGGVRVDAPGPGQGLGKELAGHDQGQRGQVLGQLRAGEGGPAGGGGDRGAAGAVEDVPGGRDTPGRERRFPGTTAPSV